MIVENRHSRAHFDKTLTALVFALAIFGVIAVSVATYTTSSSSDAPLLNHIVESTYSMRQFVFLMLAPFVVAFIYNIPYDWLRRRATLIYYGGTALLVIVLFASQASGVRAWMDIIWGFTIQPSEFAKLSMILMVPGLLSRYDKPMEYPCGTSSTLWRWCWYLA